jgi:hypothetical protein
VQTLDKYKQEIADLIEKLTPSTPPKVREQREKEAIMHIDSITQEVK